MRTFTSIVGSAAVVGGLLVAATAPATAAGPLHRPAPPKISKSSVAEDASPGSLVGRLSSADPDRGYQHTFSLVSGAGSDDNGLFQIRGKRLEVAGSLDHETDPRLSVRVRVTDRTGRTRDSQLAIAVRDVNEGPTALQLSGGSVAENAPSGTGVGTLSTTDPDVGDTFTYTVVSGAFRAVGDQLQTSAPFDYETAKSQSVTVRSTDAKGATIQRVFSVAVTDVSDSPVGPPRTNRAPYHLTPTTASVEENEDEDTLVATATALDPDGDPLTYSLVSALARCSRPHGQLAAQRRGCGPENPFAVSPNGAITTTDSLNYEYKDSYQITVKATDPGGLSTQEIVTISVEDVNEAPYALDLSNDTITEGDEGITIGTVSAYDPDEDTLTYSVVSGCLPRHPSSTQRRTPCRNVPAFAELDGTTLKTAVDLSHDDTPTFDVTIKATDPDGLSTQETFTITVDASDNHAPTDISIDNDTVAGDAGASIVGVLSAVDPDAGATFTYSVVSATGPGAVDTTSYFQVMGNTLTAYTDNCAGAHDGTHTVVIEVEDNGGLTFQKSLSIEVGTMGRHVPGDSTQRRGC